MGIETLETFTEPKKLVGNPHYQFQRQKSLRNLTEDVIDAPIIDLINEFNKLPNCFTLQSCYGHFVYKGQNDFHNLDPSPAKDAIDKVDYRIAYIALCIENSVLGRDMFESLKGITAIDPEYVQICSAEWFWKRQVNSYALQVEPGRFKRKDTAIVDFKEARHIEKTRNEFFVQLFNYLKMQRKSEISYLHSQKATREG